MVTSAEMMRRHLTEQERGGCIEQIIRETCEGLIVWRPFKGWWRGMQTSPSDCWHRIDERGLWWSFVNEKNVFLTPRDGCPDLVQKLYEAILYGKEREATAKE